MKQRVDEAYVVRTQELGESDLIVTLLAENAGKVRGVARAARRSRKRFGGALAPLTRVSVRWQVKEGRDLQRIDSLETRRSHAVLQSDPVLQAACAVVADVGAAVSREEQADPRGFRLLGSVLEAMEGGLDPLIAVRYYEYWTLRLHGLLPDLNSCHSCGKGLSPPVPRFVERGAGVVCRTCLSSSSGRNERLETVDAAFMNSAATRPPLKMPEDRRPALPGGAVELLLRSTLEAYVERTFRTYRHLYHAISIFTSGK